MNFVIAIIITVCLLISVFDLVITLVSNIKNRDRMRCGGKGTVFLADCTFVFTALSFMFTVALDTYAFRMDGTITLEVALFCLSAHLVMFFLLLSRRNQNKGMSMLISAGNSIKDSRSSLMARISHEIRTPMNTIVGLTEVISRRDDIDDSIRENLESISNASSSLLNVVNNLIDYSKIEAGRLELIEYDYSTKDMITSLIDRTEHMLKSSGVEFLAEVDDSIPKVLHGDDVRIIQALTNILSNACKYTRVGVITLRVGCSIYSSQCKLSFKIEDTGIGFNDDLKKALFGSENDSEMSLLENEKDRGTGLSLIITKSIIEKCGGKINVESQEGVGTGFDITIVQQIVDPSPIGQLITNSALRKEQHYQFTAPMSKILVVDDNMVNLFVAKELLSNYEIDIQTATSGEECLQLLSGNNTFDLIFMDYVMPGMDGHETLMRIRALPNERIKKIPIIALTAQIMSGSVKIFEDEGFQSYISKPIDVNDLEDVLLEFLPAEYICHKDASDVPVIVENVDDKPWYKRFCSALTDFDVKKGLSYCNYDYTAYLNLLRAIYNDSFTTTTKLHSFSDISDMDDYRITVHALKSVSASAGDDRLSFICAEHEKAAKAMDFAYISSNISAFIQEYDSFLSQIETVLQRESEMMTRGFDSPKVDKSEEEIQNMIASLLGALDDYNIDDAERILAEFDNINLPIDRVKALANAKDELLVFKYSEAAEIITNVFGG